MLNRQILLLPCRMLLKFGHVMTQMTVIPVRVLFKEYAKVARILPNRVTKLTFTPMIVSDNVADDGVGVTTSAGQTTTGYVKTASGAYHYGVKMWNWLP